MCVQSGSIVKSTFILHNILNQQFIKLSLDWQSAKIVEHIALVCFILYYHGLEMQVFSYIYIYIYENE